MMLWFLAFWFTGTCVLPRGAHLLGFDHSALSARGQAGPVGTGAQGRAVLVRGEANSSEPWSRA